MRTHTRRLLLVCLFVLAALPLAAQSTLTIANGWTQTVTGQDQDVSSAGLVQSQSLAPKASFNTGIPANANTLAKVVFMQGSTALANTPIMVSDVMTATLVESTLAGESALVVQLTPAPTTGSKHDVDSANLLLASKLPTREFCLRVTGRTVHGKRVLRLDNGLVLIAAGRTALAPADGGASCLCGRAIPPSKTSAGFARFDIRAVCQTAKAKKK
jgi:hypothetical protein